MNWKICIVVFINIVWALFPQNIIGCGPQADPKDYYTSFFSTKPVDDEGLRPFFYTALLKFYDDWDDYFDQSSAGPDQTDPLIKEWMDYGGRMVTEADAKALVYEAPLPVVQYFHKKALLVTAKAPVGAAEYEKNTLVKALSISAKAAALEYLAFAKRVEEATFIEDLWEGHMVKDKGKLMGLYKQAENAYGLVKDDFLKAKYAFMQCRLSFYAAEYATCIGAANQYFGLATSASAVNPMAVGYKAGAYFRTNKKADAAYWYAKAFESSSYQRKQVYLSFLFSKEKQSAGFKQQVLAKALTNKDKALIEAMFGMHGMEYTLPNMQAIYRLDKTNKYLPLLVLREVKKLEESYLSPKLSRQAGSKETFYNYFSASSPEAKVQVQKDLLFFEILANDPELAGESLFGTAAAYVAYMSGNTEQAKKWAGVVMNRSTNGNGIQQARLIALLTEVAAAQALDAKVEANLLPKLEWLKKQAATDGEYRTFMRNFFAQVLAPKYFEQGDVYKTALCLGISDLKNIEQLTNPSEEYYAGSGTMGIDYVRNDMETPQVLSLYNYLQQNAKSTYDRFLIQQTSFDVEEVADFIGTTYLRDHNWQKAIEWFKKSEETEPLIGFAYNANTYEFDSVFVDPFHDYLNDWQRYDKTLKQPMTKRELAGKIAELEKKLASSTNNSDKAAIAYSLGSVYYNLSYYGNAWMALDYYRSTVLWNTGKYTGWRKEYFEVSKARSYYEMARQYANENKEFQAAAAFLVAKCAQRQIPRPEYNYEKWAASDKAKKVFQTAFQRNPLFRSFKAEFGQTKFYKYAYNRCSYLRDFK